jgi:excisionase family DNA binding protein
MNNPIDDRLSVETPQLWDRPPLHVISGLSPAPDSTGGDRDDLTDRPPPGDRPALVLLLSIPQAGKALGIGRSKIYELISDGELETVHIGRAVRLPVDTVETFVRNLRQQPPRKPGA